MAIAGFTARWHGEGLEEIALKWSELNQGYWPSHKGEQ